MTYPYQHQFGNEKITRIRKPEGKLHRGRWVIDQTKVDKEVFTVSVQRLSRISVGRRGSNKLLKELDGDRNTEMVKVMAPLDTLREADDNIRQLPDQFEWGGKTYEVAVINHWNSPQLLSHDEVYAKRVDDDIHRHDS